MLQKTLALLLAFYLTFTQVGFGYALHFCNDQLKTIASTFELQTLDKSCCSEVESCCVMVHDTHDGCCSDVIILSDVDGNILPDFNFDFVHIGITPTNNHFFKIALDLKAQNNNLYINPPDHAPPLYALYSQRVFYC